MDNLQFEFLTNKVTKRWLTILDFFEKHRLCSSQEVSEVTQISVRTILKEIKDIREYFGESIELNANNLGYQFEEKNFGVYSKLKRDLVEQEPLFAVVQSILVGAVHTVEEWAFNVHLSESTMKRHILSIAPILFEYGIELSLTPVDFIGSEVSIRKFFKDFYYEIDNTPQTEFFSEGINNIVLTLDEQEWLKLYTNVSLADFQSYLFIMIERSKRGKNIGGFGNIIKFSKEEKTFLLSIKNNLFKTFGHQLSDNELFTLYVYCISQRTIINIEGEIKYCSRFARNERQKYLAKEFLKSYSKYMKHLFESKKELSYLIESFFISISWLDSIDNVMNKELFNVILFAKNMYPRGYEFSLEFLREYREELGLSSRYLADIAAGLVLSVEAIKDIYGINHRTIAFLFEGSYFVNRTIRAKIFRYFSGYHTIVFPTVEDLTADFIKYYKIDLFVTNTEEYIGKIRGKTDFLVFKKYPDEFDWNHLLDKINPEITRDFSLTKTALIK